MVHCSCYLLRRRRRRRNDGRSLWVWEPLQPGLRHRHGGAEHCLVLWRPELRRLLRDQVRRRRWMPPGRRLRRRHRHQLLPAQLRPRRRRRRLVQPAAAAFRPFSAGVPANRRVQSRHRPRSIQKSVVREERGDKVHDQRPLLLQPGADHQRRRLRRRGGGVGEGIEDRVAGDEPQLGAKLAEQQLPRRPVTVVQGHHQRRPQRHIGRSRAARMELRPDLRRRPVLNNSNLTHHSKSRSSINVYRRGMHKLWALFCNGPVDFHAFTSSICSVQLIFIFFSFLFLPLMSYRCGFCSASLMEKKR